MSFSLGKLKSFLPSKSENYFTRSGSTKSNKNEKLEPVVGFSLILNPTGTTTNSSGNTIIVPELQVNLKAARHLPTSFGLKSVEGYLIKIKLFPGNIKYETAIQTSSWPTFDETFKFPLASTHKSSFRNKNKDVNANSESLPNKLFKGTFVVLTVIALLELPPGSGLKATYKSLKRQGSLILKDRSRLSFSNLNSTFSSTSSAKENNDKNVQRQLTPSESQRNIGSVTCFLDPKMFEENLKTRMFATNELWLPIKDITVTPNRENKLSVASSPKGQVEMILELFENDFGSKIDNDQLNNNNTPIPSNNTNPFECDEEPSTASSSSLAKHRFSLTEMKRMIKSSKKEKQVKGLCLRITTSKMRCSIKVKEEFENVANQIYIKTTVFEHNILSSSWRSDLFSPTLSTRWEPAGSTIIIPLVNEDGLDHVSIKTTVATKTKLGKKIVLGTIYLGPNAFETLEQWQTMASNKSISVPMWHSFE